MAMCPYCEKRSLPNRSPACSVCYERQVALLRARNRDWYEGHYTTLRALVFDARSYVGRHFTMT